MSRQLVLLTAALCCAEFCAATKIWSNEDRAAYEACLARWKAVEGTWVGTLATTGVQKGSPYYQSVEVKLVFAAQHTTLLHKVGSKPWRLVGNDPRPAALEKTGPLVQVADKSRQPARGHSLTFRRLSENAAEVLYERGPIDPMPGETVLMTELVYGIMVREGSPALNEPAYKIWECRAASK